MAGRSSHPTDALYQNCLLPLERAFRLLKYQTTNENDKKQPPNYKLQSFGLDEAPVYTALSYTWGSAFEENDPNAVCEVKVDKCQLVVVNGYTIGIAPNLFHALSALHENGDDQFLWIDAICINQSNQNEKETQVPLMSTIYQNANDVVAWLGLASEDIGDVLWLHHVFLPALREKFGQWSLWSNRGKDLTTNVLRQAGVADPAGRGLALARFYRRRWFSRVWTEPEFVLARDVRFLCGPYTLKSNDVRDMKRAAGRMEAEFEQSPPEDGSWSIGRPHHSFFLETMMSSKIVPASVSGHMAMEMAVGHRIDGFELFTQEQSKACASTHLLYTAHVSRKRGCSDPRDRLYAQFGNLTRLFPSWRDDTRAPRVSYDATADSATVFRRFTLWAMEHSYYLFFLSFIQDPACKTLLQLPSWVPDFSALSTHNPMSAENHYNAVALCKTGTSFRHENEILYLRSKLVGYVDAVGSALLRDQIERGHIMDILRFSGLMPQTYQPTGETRIEALWRSLIVDTCKWTNGTHCPAPDATAHAFNEWLVVMLSSALVVEGQKLQAQMWSAQRQRISRQVVRLYSMVIFAHKHFHLLHDLSNSHAGIVPTLADAIAEATRYYAFIDQERIRKGIPWSPEQLDPQPYSGHSPYRYQMVTAIVGRRLLRSDHGHIGMGPYSMTAGDQIHILHDCKIPMILRPQGTILDSIGNSVTKYTVIGEAYVHGIMRRTVHSQAFCDSFVDITLA